METLGSSNHLQEPAICPYSEPDQSSPCTIPRSKIHVNIILPPTPRFSKWFLSLSFPHQNPIYTSPLPRTRQVSSQSHSSWFDHPNYVWWGLQIVKPLTCSLFHLCFPPPSYTQISSSAPYSRAMKLQDKWVCAERQQAFPEFHLF